MELDRFVCADFRGRAREVSKSRETFPRPYLEARGAHPERSASERKKDPLSGNVQFPWLSSNQALQ